MRPAAIIAAATLGTAAYVWWQSAKASQVPADTGSDTASADDNYSAPGAVDWLNATLDSMTNNTTINDALQSTNMQAFLTLVRTGEGTLGPNGYRTLYGGRLFDGYADHPRIAVTAGGWTSTAAGAYQILSKTWDGARAALGLTDFSPASQDAAAVWLIQRRGALGDVLAGRFDAAIAKCNKEWASLPGSPYGQPTLTLARAHAVLAANGADLGSTYA